MLHFKVRLKYATLFALSFAVFATLSFAADLLLNIEFAPPPVASALFDLINFTPIVFIGGLIFGFAQTFLSLWVNAHAKLQKWFWPVTFILAVALGGLASFFSLLTVWALVALANLIITFIMLRFLELRTLKEKPAL